MRPFLNLSLNQNISSGLALLLVFALSSALAFGTVMTGLKIADFAKRSVESDVAARNQMLQEHLNNKSTKLVPAQPLTKTK